MLKKVPVARFVVGVFLAGCVSSPQPPTTMYKGSGELVAMSQRAASQQEKADNGVSAKVAGVALPEGRAALVAPLPQDVANAPKPQDVANVAPWPVTDELLRDRNDAITKIQDRFTYAYSSATKARIEMLTLAEKEDTKGSWIWIGGLAANVTSIALMTASPLNAVWSVIFTGAGTSAMEVQHRRALDGHSRSAVLQAVKAYGDQVEVVAIEYFAALKGALVARFNPDGVSFINNIAELEVTAVKMDYLAKIPIIVVGGGDEKRLQDELKRISDDIKAINDISNSLRVHVQGTSRY